MKISLINGAPAIISDCGDVLVKDITCGLRFTENGKASAVTERGPWSLEDSDGKVSAVSDSAKLFFENEGCGISLKAEYTYLGDNLTRTDEFTVLKGSFTEHIKKLFGNTLHEANDLKVAEMQSRAETVRFSKGESFECGDFAAVELVSGAKYIAGCLTYNEFFSGLRLCEDGSFEVFQITERLPVANGTVLKSDLFHLMPCDDIVSALPRYCKLSADRSGGPRPKRETPTGSCTWYYYLSDINEDVIANSVEDMCAVRDLLPLKYMQIDDGWQVFYGQWEPNEKFPSGMKAAADNICKAGFTPGLWFAPLWANNARVRKEHPEFFPVGRDGSRTVCFDLSVPEACEHTKEVFRTATYDWGYRYLKLDGITTVLGNYNYKDPGHNSLKNYKKCLELINEATPDDTYILGCTAPMGASVGLVDGLRVSCDVGGGWSSICEVFRSVLKRYYYHNIFFTNDCDCLSVRKAENEDSECQPDKACTRTDSENRVFISATAASGGILMSSDKLRLLSREQLESISYLFPLNTEAALPLDLMESDIPGVLDCGVRGKIRTVMLINWTDEAKEMSVDTKGSSHVFEFWSKSYKGTCEDSYRTVIEPHSCEVLHIAPAGKPVVIASGSTIVPQVTQNYENGKLRASFGKAGETLYFAWNGDLDSDVGVRKVCDGIYSVTCTGGPSDMEITGH